MIDNFEQFYNILPEENIEDLTWQIMILRRSKDNPSKKTKLIKIYYIQNKHDLYNIKEGIIKLASENNARITIDYSPKRIKDVKQTLLLYLVTNLNNDIQLQYIYDTCYGKTKYPKEYKIHLIDYDESDCSDFEIKLKELNIDVINKIKTKNGWHFIAKPFNNKLITQDIHHTSPTILYIP